MTLKKLTSEQQKLLEDNLDEIRDYIRYYMFYSRTFKYKITKDLIDDALGLSIYAINEYDPSKSKQDFSKFIAQRCVFRLLDEIIRKSDCSRMTAQRRKQIKRARDKIIKTKGYCEHIDLYKEIYKYDKKKVDKILKSNINRTISLDKTKVNQDGDTFDLLQTIAMNDSSESQIEIEDMVDYICNEADRVFPVNGEKEYSPGSFNISNIIHKKLIRDYIIPKLTGEDHKTLKDIAQDLKLSESRMSQVLRGDRMNDFFNNLNIL